MEGINYPELVQTVLARHTESHLAKGTEIQLIFDDQKKTLFSNSSRLGR